MREKLFAIRRAITPAQREAAALAARQLLLSYPVFLASQRVACYFAQNDEFDCLPLIQAVWAAKKHCYLPLLPEEKNQGLAFAAYSPNDRLCLNRYRILEPEPKVIFPCDALDLVMVPLVGFDLQGGRLGMGGGFYDRTFAFLNTRSMNKPHLMGLAYECQYVEEIPEEPYDIPLDAVLTEKRIYTFPRISGGG